MSHIFLSYATDDRERVEPLRQLLSEIAPVWWDQEIRHGAAWDQLIAERLAEAACVVVVWTEKSVHSAWVRDEAADARDRGILVPVLLDDVKPPLGFRNVETAQFQRRDGSAPNRQEVEQLILSVTALVNGDPTREIPVVEYQPPRRSVQEPPGSYWRRLLSLWTVLVVIGGMASFTITVYRWLRPQAPYPVSYPVPRITSRPLDPRGIMVAETGTADLQAALGGVGQDSAGIDFHFLVDVDGSVYDLQRPGDTLLVLGVVHASRGEPQSTRFDAFGHRQMHALSALLATLAHERRIPVKRIRAAGELTPGRERKIDGWMNPLRVNVGRLVGEWRLRGSRPDSAAVRVLTLPLPRGGTGARMAVKVTFMRETTVARRNAAIRAVQGEVLLEQHDGDTEEYIIGIPADGTPDPVRRAITKLSGFPEVLKAVPDTSAQWRRLAR